MKEVGRREERKGGREEEVVPGLDMTMSAQEKLNPGLNQSSGGEKHFR